MHTRIKICGITRAQDGRAAALAGAHAIGLMFYRDSVRFITPQQALEVIQDVPPFVTTVAVFVNPQQHEVELVLNTLPIGLLQFHGDESPQFCGQFGMPFIKAVRVKQGTDLLQYAERYDHAQGLLLDTYSEIAYGGTGEVFNWGLIPENMPMPLILSGGLNPENVAQAVRQVKPWAVDVSSGVEADKGIKDATKIANFVQGVRSADV